MIDKNKVVDEFEEHNKFVDDQLFEPKRTKSASNLKNQHPYHEFRNQSEGRRRVTSLKKKRDPNQSQGKISKKSGRSRVDSETETLLSEYDGKSTIKVGGYEDVNFKQMMEYYNPMWMAWVGIIASIFASLSLPLFGFVLSKYIFLIALPIDTQA